MLLRWGRRVAEAEEEGAVVTLEVDGDGVEATEEEEVVVGAVAEVVDMVDGSKVSVEDMVCTIGGGWIGGSRWERGSKGKSQGK